MPDVQEEAVAAVNQGPYERCYVVHYPGYYRCECGSEHHDPVSGLCQVCDPVLYRVVGYTDAFFGPRAAPAIERFVGERKLADTIKDVLKATGRSVEIHLA